MNTPQGTPPPGARSAHFGSLIGGFLGGALLAAGAAFLLWPSPGQVEGASDPSGDGGGAGNSAFGPSPVDVVAAVETIAAEPVQLLGTARPVRDSLVASEVDGLVVEVFVDEGDAVRTGAVLVRLRTATIEQQLAGARAAQEETVARLARAETDFDRLERLLQRQAISRREYDQAVADRDALAQGVARFEAEALRLQYMLENATVRAPFSGRVTAVHVELGEWVGRGDPIVSLVDLSRVEVAVQIAERYISAVEPGFPVDIRFDALPGRSYTGVVRAVVPEASPSARTFPVLIRVANRDLAIKGGMAARVTAQLGSPLPTMLVSKDAIVRRGDQVVIYRVREQSRGEATADDGAEIGEGTSGVIELVSVRLGPARGQWQVAYGPIAAGDLIVVRGNERVFPGQPVTVAAIRRLPIPQANPDRPIALDPRQTEGS